MLYAGGVFLEHVREPHVRPDPRGRLVLGLHWPPCGRRILPEIPAQDSRGGARNEGEKVSVRPLARYWIEAHVIDRPLYRAIHVHFLALLGVPRISDAHHARIFEIIEMIGHVLKGHIKPVSKVRWGSRVVVDCG